MAPMNNRLMRPRASGFNPKSISGLAIWLDGASLASGSVATWEDKSGNGRNATQTTGNNQPTTLTVNGKNAVKFDGSNDTLSCSFPWSATSTFFLVASPATAASRYVLAGSALSATPAVISEFNDVDFEWFSAAANDRLTFAASAPGQQVLSVTHTDGGALIVRRNGATVASKTTAASTLAGASNVWLGSSTGSANFYNGTICEIILYHNILTASARQTVERYLGTKWGVTVA
jgi:hypothetical protein